MGEELESLGLYLNYFLTFAGVRLIKSNGK